jgi:AraC-like DNA-binding protein
VHSLNQIRVERSKDLLRDHSISLAEITEMVGFEDQSYFTKVFNRHAGMSPGQFRKNRGQPLESNLEAHEKRMLSIVKVRQSRNEYPVSLSLSTRQSAHI